MQDPIIQTKACRQCQTSFEITQWDMEFYEKISPTFAGKKFQIPTPTLCPECRQQRRLAFRNERNLYRRTCDASGKQIISMYNPECGYKVYDQKIWWSDQWDPMSYGREFDFTKTFTEQFGELMREMPHLSLLGVQNELSDYVNGVFAWTRSYLCFNCDYIEDCMYVQNSLRLKKSLDCLSCMNSELLYWCLVCDNCYQCNYCLSCQDCSFCYQCNDLIGKSYCVHNIQYTKAEYFEVQSKTKHGIIPSTINDIHSHNNHDCRNIYDCWNLEDCKNCYYVYDSKDCMDFDVFGDNSSLIYEWLAIGPNSYSNIFSACCRWWSTHCSYSFLIVGRSHCFWCIGLRNKQYCIFNKQYTKDDYEKTVAKIIAHMQETWERGEFFHPSLSPFGYNETVAHEYFPSSIIEKNDNNDVISYHGLPRFARNDDGLELSQLWYKRSEYEAPKPVSDKVIEGKDLPDSIAEVEDSILQFVISCELTGKLFRIQPQELIFYRKHHIPLPRKHPDQRHLERLALRR